MLIGNFLGGLVEVFLYSILHSYYCYEFKTALMEMDFLSSVAYFEAQWPYFWGFGSVFTLGLYLFKEVGSSLFFLFFPIMVMVSLDEDGQGVLAYKETRVCNSFSFPILTLAYRPYTWVLRKINDYVVNL
jgi:hypothetical protein